MRSGAIPFKFDLTSLWARARRQVGSVTVSLPFISIAVSPNDLERKVARELVVRLKDRRVLSAWECCDDCIDRALASLQEIRKLLVEKQVELSDVLDGPLYLLIDAMALGIRHSAISDIRRIAQAAWRCAGSSSISRSQSAPRCAASVF